MAIRRNHIGYRVGECHQKTTLTDEQVRLIRAMYLPGKVGYETLAKRFNCGASTIRDIVTYRTRPA